MPRVIRLSKERMIKLYSVAGRKLLKKKRYNDLGKLLNLRRRVLVRHLKLLGLYDFQSCDLSEEIEYSPGGNPRIPTDHPPGSMEKISVLAWRAQRGMNLHHPRDRRCYSIANESA